MLLLAALTVTVSAGCDDGDTSTGGSTVTAVATAPGGTAAPSALPLVTVRAGDATLRVELAASAEARARGLTGRPSLPADSGMLFDLGSSYVPSFWMKDVLIPLDIVWLDEERRVISVSAAEPQPGVPDADQRHYSPERRARYVLELNAGTADRLGLQAGDTVDFDLEDL